MWLLWPVLLAVCAVAVWRGMHGAARLTGKLDDAARMTRAAERQERGER